MCENLRQRLRDAGLSGIASKLEPFKVPSIRLITQQVDEEHLQLGASKIGGHPDLPQGVDWPMRNGVPLCFVAQVNLSTACHHDSQRMLPTCGTVSFFYDDQDIPCGVDPADRDGWKVIYFSGDLSCLRRRTSPPVAGERDRHYPACALTFDEDATFPSKGSPELEEAGLTDEEEDLYSDVLAQLADEMESVGIHRMLGYPDVIQNEMRLDIQLASNGLYPGDQSGYQDPRVERLAEGAEDWTLLLQIDSDDKAEMMWGDCGRIYFWIRRQELADQHFENVWLMSQCY